MLHMSYITVWYRPINLSTGYGVIPPAGMFMSVTSQLWKTNKCVAQMDVTEPVGTHAKQQETPHLNIHGIIAVENPHRGLPLAAFQENVPDTQTRFPN